MGVVLLRLRLYEEVVRVSEITGGPEGVYSEYDNFTSFSLCTLQYTLCYINFAVLAHGSPVTILAHTRTESS